VSEIRTVRIQTAEPRGARYPGAVEEGHYVVEGGDTITLVDKRGTAIDKHQYSRAVKPGEDPHSIAAVLLRQWKKPKSSDFNRVLHYPKVVY
jgi:hypothetical protein